MADARRAVLKDIALNLDEPPKVSANDKRPACPNDNKTLKTSGERQTTDNRASRKPRSIVTDAAATPSLLNKKRGANLFRKCLAEHAVMTSTPAPMTAATKQVLKPPLSMTTRSAEKRRVKRRSSSHGRLPECPVSPIAAGPLSRVICPRDEEEPDVGSPAPPTSSSPTQMVEKRGRKVRRPAKNYSESENHATPDDFSCGSFDRSRSNRSYSRTPKQSKDWELIANDITCDDDDDDGENQEKDGDNETVIKADGFNPDGFLIIDGSKTLMPTKRGNVTVKRSSPLEGGYYSPRTVIKRKRPQKREPPVWDEARYANEFNAMNAEFEKIERTELCVVFEDQSKGGHCVR